MNTGARISNGSGPSFTTRGRPSPNWNAGKGKSAGASGRDDETGTEPVAGHWELRRNHPGMRTSGSRGVRFGLARRAPQQSGPLSGTAPGAGRHRRPHQPRVAGNGRAVAAPLSSHGRGRGGGHGGHDLGRPPHPGCRGGIRAGGVRRLRPVGQAARQPAGGRSRPAAASLDRDPRDASGPVLPRGRRDGRTEAGAAAGAAHLVRRLDRTRHRSCGSAGRRLAGRAVGRVDGAVVVREVVPAGARRDGQGAGGGRRVPLRLRRGTPPNRRWHPPGTLSSRPTRTCTSAGRTPSSSGRPES